MLVYICDDSPEDRRKLEFILDKYSLEIDIKFEKEFFESGDKLLDAIETGCPVPDLLFLDIFMHGITGDEVAKKLREYNINCGIIFTTSSMQHAMASYEVDALYYLQKPYTYDNFKSAMVRCASIFDAVDTTYTISVHGRSIKLKHKDIIFFETGNHNVIVHIDGHEYSFMSSIGKVAQELSHKNSFLPCGRSYLINLEHVSGYNDGELTFDNGDIISVPFRERDKIRTILNC